VVEVTRPDPRTPHSRGKSDPIDAESAARAAPSGEATAAPEDRTSAVEAIRVLRVAHDGRRQGPYRRAAPDQGAHDHRARALLGPLRGLTLRAAARHCARMRPDPDALADPDQVTRAALKAVAGRIAALEAEIALADRWLTAQVAQAAPRTTALLGVSTGHAGQLLLTAGANPHRLGSEAAFAALRATSAVPANSGKTNRHPINPGGDRAASRALHLIAVVRMRWHEPTRTYVARRTAKGLSKREIIRCPKRSIGREAHHAITAHPAPPDADRHGQGGRGQATTGAADRPRGPRTSRHPSGA
jgi:transposase